MADMARLAQVEDCWDALTDAGVADERRTGHLHELLGRHQGVLRPPRRRGLHVEQRRRRARVGVRRRSPDAKVLFLPDQHLGRNTAVLKLGHDASTTASCGTRASPTAALTPEELRDARMILWKGHCSVHGRFSADVVDELRATHARHPGPGPPRVHARGRARRPTWSARRSSSSRPIEAAPAGLELGDRHRAQPRAAARATRTPSRRSSSSTGTSATARR